MDTSTKLRLLGGSAIADREGWPQRVKGLLGARTPGVFPVQLPGGHTMPILSTLMTNMRLHPFELGELPFDSQGNLPQERDLKLAWALDHPERFPLDLARASREELLRVPGIGPLTARRIVESRAQGGPRSLARPGAIPARARPFLLLGGRRLARKLPGGPEPPGEQFRLLQGDGEEKPGPLATHIPPCAFR
ncbi:MAG: hypothetical protein ACE5JJ_01705 [Nitrospinota bacterium]